MPSMLHSMEKKALHGGVQPYDLIILDLMFPSSTDLAVLQRLRPPGHAVPVLVLTARDEKESIVALLNAGADDYVAKPFDLGEFWRVRRP